MKHPDECENIEDIRECIDHIDKSIIEHLAHRSSYVKSASSFKKTLSDVKGSDRVVAMINSRRAWASDAGINSDFVESLFRCIVDFFIKSETVHWQKEQPTIKELVITQATIGDARDILDLQKRAFIQEAELIRNYTIGPIVQTFEQMLEDFKRFTIIKAVNGSQIIGSARGKCIDDIGYIGRVIIEPIFQKQGYGRALMGAIEAMFPTAKEFELFTGENSVGNLKFYSKLGYSVTEKFIDSDGVLLVRMRKTRECRMAV